MPIGKNIAYCRKQLNLSQADLAKSLNLKSATTVSQWERKKAFPSRNTVKQMSKMFGRDIEDMYDVDLERQDIELMGFHPTPDEIQNILRFRELPEIVKGAISAAINHAYNEMQKNH